MKIFEVAVPLKKCKHVRIEPSDELGELMVAYKFPLDHVLLRQITKDIKMNVLEDYFNEKN